MSSCLFLGDSIALGLALITPVCDRNAVVGRSSTVIAAQTINKPYERVYISSGSNDPNNPNLLRNLTRTRQKVRGSHVTWILPANRQASAVVRSVAVRYGDSVVSFRTARDGVHPASYRTLKKVIF